MVKIWLYKALGGSKGKIIIPEVEVRNELRPMLIRRVEVEPFTMDLSDAEPVICRVTDESSCNVSMKGDIRPLLTLVKICLTLDSPFV